jgi:hypothetical protein
MLYPQQYSIGAAFLPHQSSPTRSLTDSLVHPLLDRLGTLLQSLVAFRLPLFILAYSINKCSSVLCLFLSVRYLRLKSYNLRFLLVSDVTQADSPFHQMPSQPSARLLDAS